MKINNIFFLLILISINSLFSCVSSTITAIAGNAVISEKGVVQSFDDTVIFTKINSLIINEYNIKIADIYISVNEGQVLLAGIMNDEKHRLSLIKKVWSVNGVKKIFNEIKVGEKYSLIDRSKDFILKSKIKTFLLLNHQIYSNNYNIVSFKGIIYLMGNISNFREIEIIEKYIKNFSGVKKLKSMLILKK